MSQRFIKLDKLQDVRYLLKFSNINRRRESMEKCPSDKELSFLNVMSMSTEDKAFYFEKLIYDLVSIPEHEKTTADVQRLRLAWDRFYFYSGLNKAETEKDEEEDEDL